MVSGCVDMGLCEWWEAIGMEDRCGERGRGEWRRGRGIGKWLKQSLTAEWLKRMQQKYVIVQELEWSFLVSD